MRPLRMTYVLIWVATGVLPAVNGCGKTTTDGSSAGSGGTATAGAGGVGGMPTAGSGGNALGGAGGGSKASGGATSTGGVSGAGGSSIVCPVGGECRVESGRCVCIGGVGGAPGTGGATSTGGISGAGGSSIACATWAECRVEYGRCVCQGGIGGAPGTGGARTMDAGLSACQTIDALDRSCTADTDCVAVKHTSSCCGQIRYIGIRQTEKARFDANEPACDASYPACGCAAQSPLMDDGSVDIRQTVQPGVKCQLGTCTTFVRDCAKPCAAGTTCFTCTTPSLWFGACTVPCANSSDCPSSLGMPSCTTANGTSGNTSGSFCAYADTLCDSK
jgi:hypothetical protein